MRRAEEWAKECDHWKNLEKHDHLLCVDCARAYARECVTRWKETVEAAILVAQWVGHRPSCAVRGCTCESAEKLPDAVNEFHRKRRVLPGEVL